MGKDLLFALYKHLRESEEMGQLGEDNSKAKLNETIKQDERRVKCPKCGEEADVAFYDAGCKKCGVKKREEVKATEGKIPSDPAKVDAKTVKTLTEKEKDTELEAAKRRDAKAKEDEINKKELDKKKDEGKIPKDPVVVDDKTIKTLTEKEVVLGEFSDEKVARDLATEKKGVAVLDPVSKKWRVVVTEVKEPVKEDVEVTVKADGKETMVVAVDGGGIQVTSVETAEQPLDRVATIADEPVPAEVVEPVVEEPIKAEESKVVEGKKEEKAAEELTKAATSLLRRIHKAESVEGLQDIGDMLEKSAVGGKISDAQETRLNAALRRRREILKDNPKAPATEPTKAEEEEVEGKEEVKEKVMDVKVNESADDFTYGFLTEVYKALKGIGVTIDKVKLGDHLAGMEKVGLEAVKAAIKGGDTVVLQQLVSSIAEGK